RAIQPMQFFPIPHNRKRIRSNPIARRFNHRQRNRRRNRRIHRISPRAQHRQSRLPRQRLRRRHHIPPHHRAPPRPIFLPPKPVALFLHTIHYAPTSPNSTSPPPISSSCSL